jgi:DNA-binding MarR family transcriptional regulator
MTEDVSADDYRALAEFRFRLRAFLRFSEDLAHASGIEPQQHQLLLMLRGLGQHDTATVAELAAWLQIRHHSTGELVDRAADHGLVQRQPDPTDGRKVLVALTPGGATALAALSCEHRDELRQSGPRLIEAIHQLLNGLGQAETQKETSTPYASTAIS